MSDIVFAFLGVVVNGKGARLFPSGAQLYASAAGWFFTASLLRAKSVKVFSVALAVQGVVAALFLFHKRLAKYGKSALVSRTVYYPFIASLLSVLSGLFLKKPGFIFLAVAILSQAWSALGGFLMLLCYPASIVQVLESQEEREARFSAATVLLQSTGKSVSRALVVSPITGQLLDTAVVRPRQPSLYWVIYVGGNAEIFENTIDDVGISADIFQSNILFLNPRGIGRSTGYVSQLSDLVEDCASVVNHYVKAESIDPQKLLFLGHSIGGGISAEVVAKCSPESALVLDRTFSSLSEAAICFSPLTPWLTKKLLPLFIGDLHTMKYFHLCCHNRKLIVFSKRDEILKFEICSPARLNLPAETVVLELHGQNIPSWHNCDFNSFREEKEIYEKIRELLQSTSK